MFNHPRPDFKRENIIMLDGSWTFAFEEKEKQLKCDDVFDLSINVPFVYQSELSGINKNNYSDTIWYKKSFNIKKEDNKSYILNFGAVDYIATVYCNNHLVGTHKGGYSSFKFDISQYIQNGDNSISVKVIDEFFNKSQPRGKQKWTTLERFGCFYKEYSGIWQSVWIEITGISYINSFKIIPNVKEKEIDLEVLVNNQSDAILEVEILFQKTSIKKIKYVLEEKRFAQTINISHSAFPWDGIAYWNVDTPNLYDINLRLISNDLCLDCVSSYFGMRDITVRDGRILINALPIYQKLLLNQGYYPKGYITPENFDVFADDVKQIKEMGFNGIRIHEKIENPLFLYECDRQGLFVWEELPSAYEFTDEAIQNLTNEWIEIIKRDINHPSIITWVTTNESWGVLGLRTDKRQQAFVKSLYNLTKAIDGSRLVIGNDGWEHTETDIVTVHDYVPNGEALFDNYCDKEKMLHNMIGPLHPRFVFADGYGYKGQPIILSEFVGIAVEGSDGWGYDGKAKNNEDLQNRIEGLITAVKKIPYFCGYCFTQFTDVEEEHNGILYFDRTPKIPISKIKEINDYNYKWI